MGKKLGNALIIYGVLNFVASWFFGIPALVLGALIWMVIMIFLGNWQRGKARAQQSRDKQTQLLQSMDSKQDDLANAINRVLDDRERRARESMK